MGMKEFLEKKKEGYDRFMEKRDLDIQRRKATEHLKMKLDAETAEEGIKEEKMKSKINKYKELKQKNIDKQFKKTAKTVKKYENLFTGTGGLTEDTMSQVVQFNSNFGFSQPNLFGKIEHTEHEKQPLIRMEGKHQIMPKGSNILGGFDGSSIGNIFPKRKK